MDFIRFVYQNNPTPLGLIGLVVISAIYVVINMHRWKKPEQTKLGWAVLVLLTFVAIYLMAADWRSYTASQTQTNSDAAQPATGTLPAPPSTKAPSTTCITEPGLTPRYKVRVASSYIAGQVVDRESMRPVVGGKISIDKFDLGSPNSNGTFHSEIPKSLVAQGILIIQHPDYVTYRLNLALQSDKQNLYIPLEPLHQSK